MTTAIRKPCITILLLSFFIHTHAQDRAQDHNSSRSNKTASKAQDHNSSRSNKSASRAQDHNSSRSNKSASAQDHNSSRSNKTASKAQQDDWTFGVNSGASFSLRNKESGLFRGNSMATKLFTRYNFGNIGLGFSSGIIPGSISNNALNQFIADRKFQQALVTKSNPLNSYLLFGPSFRFGNRVIVNTEIQAGMFINNPGTVSIGQTGAVRPLYRFENAGKSVFPGFSGNISLAYPVNNSTRFFINTDYLQSKSSIRLYDPQQGVDVAVEQDRLVRLFTVGAGITKSFGSKKHIANAKYETFAIEEAAIQERINATTRRHAINTKGTGATNGRIAAPGQYHAINTKGTGASNGRMMQNENCGIVLQTITTPDGTVEELSFACPEDAAAYNSSMENSPGNKNIAYRDLAARNIISGRLSWRSVDGNTGIVTNASIVNVSRQTPKRDFGDRVKIGIRGATNEKTKKLKDYGLIFADQGNASFTSSLGSVKNNPLYSSIEVTGNPLYIPDALDHTNPLYQGQNKSGDNPLFEGGGMSGNNPMHEANMSSSGNSLPHTGETADYNCDGIAGITVSLIDIESGATVATTNTETCGDFFFANAPDGKYILKLSGAMLIRKGYELHAASKLDLLGIVQQGDQQAELLLNTERSDQMQKKAGVSTSRSNIRTKTITIIGADVNGDGENPATKIIMGFNDGTSRDVTAYSKVTSDKGNKKVVVRGWDPEKKQERNASGNTNAEYTIIINGANSEVSVTSQFSNGTNKEIQSGVALSHHPGVVQFTITVDESAAESEESERRIKTKSNIKNDRIAAGNVSIKTLTLARGDVDDDGVPEMLLGGALPGGAVISAAMRPGGPIGGIIVKGGKNPGGALRTVQTNENGEFEFQALDAGDYLFSIEQKLVIADETMITLESNSIPVQQKGIQENGKGINEASIKRTANSNSDAAKTHLQSFLVSLDELDRLLNADQVSSPVAIHTVKEKSRLVRSFAVQLEKSVQNTNTERVSNTTDTEFAVLLNSVIKLGQQYATISNVLKTRHDVALNAIRNMK
jgi:hypothetical protein